MSEQAEKRVAKKGSPPSEEAEGATGGSEGERAQAEEANRVRRRIFGRFELNRSGLQRLAKSMASAEEFAMWSVTALEIRMKQTDTYYAELQTMRRS